MKRKSTPFGRAGSKTNLAKWIIHNASGIPHTRWGELFAGTGVVTLNKEPVEWEFLNDRDAWIVDCLSVFRDQESRAELMRRLKKTPWSELEFTASCEIIKGIRPCPEDPIEKARIFLVNNLQSFNRSGRTHTRSAKVDVIRKWKRLPEKIEAFANRITQCHLFHRDYRDVLQLPEVDDPQTLVYADPPYFGVEKNFYNENKVEGFNHKLLRASLDGCRASCIVSYEDCPQVRDLYLSEDGWQIEQKRVRRALGNNSKMTFPPQSSPGCL